MEAYWNTVLIIVTKSSNVGSLNIGGLNIGSLSDTLIIPKTPAGIRGFISFHVEQSEIFHNFRKKIISHFA